MHPDDQQLISKIQERDEAAFEVFHERYRDAIRRHILHMVHDAPIADDLVQEVFLRVWTRAEQWDGRGAARSWLYQIGTNLALNHLRSVRRRPQQALPKSNSDGDEESLVPAWMIDSAALQPDAVAVSTEQQEHIWGMVDDLPDNKRAVFRMVYDDDMDLRSVADALGIPEGTVKSRLYYSKRKLAQRWKQQ